MSTIPAAGRGSVMARIVPLLPDAPFMGGPPASRFCSSAEDIQTHLEAAISMRVGHDLALGAEMFDCCCSSSSSRLVCNFALLRWWLPAPQPSNSMSKAAATDCNAGHVSINE